MNKSKQAKASEHEDGADMISSLSDHVLQLILSRLQGTEEVIRTSILSRRWRYLWTSFPSIDIDYTRGLKPSEEFETDKFREFVYWVLLNKRLDLDSFRLSCSDYYNMSTIRQWIHVAVMRKVKLLDLKFCPTEDIELPHSMVTCDSLEVLKLCFLEDHLCLPKITGFPALRVLELNDVELKKSNSVNYFLESCPLLEDLSVIDCIVNEFQNICISSLKLKNLRMENHHEEEGEFWHTRMSESIEISCPKLVFLKLTGSLTYEFLFESLHSLKEAVIHLDHLFERDEGRTFDFFDKISHVESLSINLYCLGQCFDREVDTRVSLPNLKTLELIFHVYPNVHELILFLKYLPHLESLHLIIPEDKDAYRSENWKLDDAETITVLTRHLKKVEFLGFNGEKPRVVIARSLLDHGNALEEMVFSWGHGNEASFHETMKQVSKFHKASSTVKLTVVFNPTQANSIPAPNLLETDSIHVESSNSSVKILGT